MDSDHDDLFNTWVLINRLFDDAWIHVKSAAQQHVLGAVDNKDISVFVHVSDVAGSKKTVLGHRLLRCICALPISLHDVGAADANLAFFTQAHIAGWIVDVSKLDSNARNWNPARAWLHRAFKWCKCTCWRRLGHTPAFSQPAAGDVLKALLHLQRKRGPSRSAPLDRR